MRTGEFVAVKILRPHVLRDYKYDIYLGYKIAGMMEAVVPSTIYLQPTNTIKYFDEFLLAQLDLTTEANNLSKFIYNFRFDPFIKFPEPIFCSKSLLIESWEDGVPMNEYLQREKKDVILACKGTRAYLQMLLVDNFMHGDLHPGNILVKPEQGILVLLDAGLTLSLTQHLRVNLFDLLMSMSTGNGYKVGKLLIDRMPEGSPEPIDPEGFCRAIERINKDSTDNNRFVLSKLKIASVLTEMFQLCCKHHVTMDSSFITLFASIVLLEGIGIFKIKNVGRQIDPYQDIFSALGGYLKDAQEEYKGFRQILLKDIIDQSLGGKCRHS